MTEKGREREREGDDEIVRGPLIKLKVKKNLKHILILKNI